MDSPDPDFLLILRTLTEYKVDFIVVGGVCAALHGAAVDTFDLDVVHSREQDNLDRLLDALQNLDAYYRGQGDRRLTPKLSHLASPGHQLLVTRGGPLDLLAEIGTELDYEDLLGQTVEIPLADNLNVRILNLETLIMIKEQLGRDRDKAVLPILRRALEQRSNP